MTSARLNIFGPIPHPKTWCISPDCEPPAGFMRLAGCSITRSPKTPGTALVRSEVVDGDLQTQLERLLQAFHRCDESSRTEIINIAERLAGAA